MSSVVQSGLKFTFKLAAGLIIVLFISLLLLLWRLSATPIQLDQFVPRIERAASALPGGLRVKLKGIGLFWDRAQRQIDLKALNVELVESSGTSLVYAPEVKISLSVFALMRGVVALSSIELQDVDVQLVRREDGSFQIFKKTNTRPGVDSDNIPWDFSENIQHIFKVLASEADPQVPLSYLKRLKIMGSLGIEDRKNGMHWAADAVESLFVGHKGEVRGDLGVRFSSPQAMDGINADIVLNLKNDTVSASLEFAGVRSVGFSVLDQRLAGLDMTFNGTINTRMTLPDRVHSLTANIKGGTGQFSYQDFFPVPLKINSLGLQLSADLPGKSVQVSNLDILFGEAETPLKLNLRGAAQLVENAVSFKLETLLQQLKVKALDLYWPRGIAIEARNWLVTNLKAGTVKNAKVNLAMVLPTGPKTDFQLKELKGSMDYSDLTLAYFGSLPPATGVTGSGTFDQYGFDLGISEGLVNGVSIESGKVVISGMDSKKPSISVKTHLNGQLAAVFAVLEAPPIKLNSDSVTGLLSEQLGGQIESDFSIALPLASELADGDIEYQASGKIIDGALSRFYRNYDLRAADIDFNLDHTKLKFKGPLAFSGIPLTIDWTTFLVGPSKGHADFTIKAPNITGTQISSLGYDVSKYLQGSIALKTTAKVAPGGRVTASIESDLNNAALAIPQIKWNKAAGAGGKIGFTLLKEKNHLQAKDINVELGRVKTSGNAEFDMTGSQMSLALEHLSLSYAQLNGLQLSCTENKHLKITLQGGEASLEPFMPGNRDPLEKQVAEESEAIAEKLESSGFVFEIGKSKLDKVYINKENYFDNIQFSGRRDNKGWHEVNVSGHNPFAGSKVGGIIQSAAAGKLESGQFSVVYGPAENDTYQLHIEAEDLGLLVSAVKGKNIMGGGYFVLTGNSKGPLLAKPIQANFELNSFTVKEAPTISNVLNVASLIQIISTLRQTGLSFHSAYGDLNLNGARLSSKQVRMDGGSLSLLTSGWVELKQQNMELKGTIVPLSKLNNIIGKMPLMGQVVSGEDGKGIMAVDYTVKGGISAPEVSIQKTPLTPGILENTGDM